MAKIERRSCLFKGQSLISEAAVLRMQRAISSIMASSFIDLFMGEIEVYQCVGDWVTNPVDSVLRLEITEGYGDDTFADNMQKVLTENLEIWSHTHIDAYLEAVKSQKNFVDFLEKIPKHLLCSRMNIDIAPEKHLFLFMASTEDDRLNTEILRAIADIVSSKESRIENE